MKFAQEQIIKLFKRTFSLSYIRNIALVAGLTFGVKFIGFFKESVIASKYGLSEFIDTFLIAILIPSFINSVFIDSLKNIFIPNYILEQKSSNQKGAFQSITLILMLVIISILVLFNILFSDTLLEFIYPNHTLSYYSLVKKQMYILLPCLFFWGLSSFFGGLLEVKNQFFITSISGVFVPLAILFCIYFLNGLLGNMVLAYGTLLGSFLGFSLIIFNAVRNDVIHFSRPKLNWNIRMMFNQLPAKITSGFLVGLNNFVDQFFAAQLAFGSIAALNYGIKIPSFILGISMVSFGSVLLPHFSKLIVENTKSAFEHLFKILKYVFIVGLLVVVSIMYFSPEIVKILFERNEFTANDTIVVSNIQRIILVYVPFYLCGHILVKFLTSINKNKFMALASFAKLVCNIILNIIFVKKYGLYGLAVSTTIIFIANTFIYLAFTIFQYKKILNQNATS
ncbi:murein biosynthesis integral membrane protein MurJ [uncultured Croceitalea sp.]|uniref:murein biosynthesis integral membrane protein MurJ n=1 Tax=uncultured Croceitalea sp. TaxID=1798908 RepID=UPI00374E844F